MRLTRTEPRRSNLKRVEPVILFAIGGAMFAIPASSVDEIRNLDGLMPCKLNASYSNLRKVTFTFERNKKNYVVVDSNLHFRMQPSQPARMLVLRNSSVAVLVDSIDRMCELTAIRKLPQAFIGEERVWYRGLTVVRDQLIPVVNPQAFLSKAESAIALAEISRTAVATERTRAATAQGAASA